jgi:hypothetical protein
MDISVYLKRTDAIPHGGIVSENCCRPAREGLFQSIDCDQGSLTHTIGADFGLGELCNALWVPGGAIHINTHGYLGQIPLLAGSGHATEHSDYPALEGLLKSIDDNLTIIDEPNTARSASLLRHFPSLFLIGFAGDE